ncbi:MAG: DUF5682 family protein [Trueperaceae bacterium]
MSHEPPKIFGIRHHGPGSARSLLTALQDLQPDIVLVEGPADATDMLPWLAHEEMEPPVSLLVYRPDNPKRAGFFPFAVFSPEWQGIRYALQQNISVRFMDLPQGVFLANDIKLAMPDGGVMETLAKAAGYKHYEHYWNALVEQRSDDSQLFTGVFEMMIALRDEAAKNLETRLPTMKPEEKEGERLAEAREAYMRQSIRNAQREGFKKIAVICGAWHSPALRVEQYDDVVDATLLASFKTADIEAAWVPWSYSRLASWKGYGAGIQSPGWYQHLWDTRNAERNSVQWLTRVSELLRREGFDTSSAHIIETVRLAESLAAIRDLALPGLTELSEATQTVMCFGDVLPMRLIQEKLIVGERRGVVPSDSPMVPLQRNLRDEQRRLKLRAELSKSTLSLDLRNETHLERSHLLHRLCLLNTPWGQIVPVRGKGGTYREMWSLQWAPEFTLRVIEANVWGNTVLDATTEYAKELVKQAKNLASLTQLLDNIILANITNVLPHVMLRIDEEAASSHDIQHMIDALQPLVRVLRYGSVRQTDKTMLQHVVDSLVTRICIGLPATCASMNNEAATEMLERLNSMNTVITTLQNKEHRTNWQGVLKALIDMPSVHGLIAGRSCRLLLEAKIFSSTDAMQRLERAMFLSPIATRSVEELLQTAFWLEGFLKGSGLLLIHDETLWQLIAAWVEDVKSEQFVEVLPLLRRTFSSFNENIRQQLSERVKRGEVVESFVMPTEFNSTQAEKVLPLVRQLLGIL